MLMSHFNILIPFNFQYFFRNLRYFRADFKITVNITTDLIGNANIYFITSLLHLILLTIYHSIQIVMKTSKYILTISFLINSEQINSISFLSLPHKEVSRVLWKIEQDMWISDFLRYSQIKFLKSCSSDEIVTNNKLIRGPLLIK